jgi:hypothetical protein
MSDQMDFLLVGIVCFQVKSELSNALITNVSSENVARLKVTLAPFFIISKGTNQDGSKIINRRVPRQSKNN